MPKWFEITEAIKHLEHADQRMTDLQAERETERKKRIEYFDALDDIAKGRTAGFSPAEFADRTINPFNYFKLN